MADIYVRSTTGNNANNGSSWALAKATLAGADAIDAAGDNIYVSQSHSETTAASITFAFAGTPQNPTKIICCDDGSTPPTVFSDAAVVATTGNSGVSVNQGAGLFVRGLAFRPALNSLFLQASNSPDALAVYKFCKFNVPNNSTSTFVIGSSGSSNSAKSRIKLDRCEVLFGAAQGRIEAYVEFEMVGGSISGVFPGQLHLLRIGSNGRGPAVSFSNVDMSGLGASTDFIRADAAGTVVFSNCKLPASWTGSLVQSGIRSIALRASLYNCDSGDTNYRVWVDDFAGSLRDETTVVRTGGASDGATPISWRITTTDSSSELTSPFRSDPIAIWNATAGTPITATLEVLTDNVTLTDADCWAEVEYMGASGSPLGFVTDDARPNVFASASNQLTSTTPWTTTGISTPVKQKLSVTFTPQKAGPLYVTVKVGRPSTTVYVDPKVTVT